MWGNVNYKQGLFTGITWKDMAVEPDEVVSVLI